MICMARTFGAPGQGPGRQGGPQDVDRALARGQPARHLGGQVHDVAVALDHHHLVDHLGPEADHPAHVVAGQVDQHHVLGHLLGVLDQLGLEPGVVLGGGPRRLEPAIGRETTVPSRSRTMGSGEAPTTVTSGKRRK